MADDARIGQQPRDLGLAPCGDHVRIEALECGAKILALAQDREPGQPGLKPVEHELFPKRAAVASGTPHSVS